MASRITDSGAGKLKRYFRRLRETDGLEVVVGIPESEGAKSRDGITMAELGSIHEFGTATIPARSFIRETFDQSVNRFAAVFERAVNRVISKKASPRQQLFQIGEMARQAILDRINKGIKPALKQSTIDRKGSSLPLVDTGQLRASIKSVVRRERKD